MKMNNFSRRQFLQVAGCSAALFSLPLTSCQDAVQELIVGEKSVIWLEGATCTGCGVSLLNASGPDVTSLLTDVIVLRFHETLMAQSGTHALEVLDKAAEGAYGPFFLILDGTFPIGEYAAFTSIGSKGDLEITALEAAKKLSGVAAGILALGTCASFGGIPASVPTITNSVSANQALERTDIIRIPGCPPNPTWMIATIIALAAGQTIALDDKGRPLALYGKTVHDLCPRRDAYEQSDFAVVPGDPHRCFFEIGCKGPFTFAACPQTLWHDQRTFCIAANHPCIGCAAPGFIDRARQTSHYPMSPFYE